MGLGGLAVIGLALALAVASVAGVLGAQRSGDGGQPIDLVDARKNEADDDPRAAGDDADDDEDDTTGDGPSADRPGASRGEQPAAAAGDTGDTGGPGDRTVAGDTTGLGARPAPAPAPAPAGTAPRRSQPAPRTAPAPAASGTAPRRSQPAPRTAPAPAASAHSVDAPSRGGDTS